jgi:hypothetical protein
MNECEYEEKILKFDERREFIHANQEAKDGCETEEIYQ